MKKLRRSGTDKTAGHETAALTLDETWKDAIRALHDPRIRTLFLSGYPGIGKTHAAIYEGRTQNGVCSVTMTQDTPSAELRGSFFPKGMEFPWEDGIVTRAMRTGQRLLINEISHAPDEVLAFLYAVLDSKETSRFTLPTGEEISPAPGFHCVAADNQPLQSLPAALRDRFEVHIEIERPHPQALARLRPELREAFLNTYALDDERRTTMRQWLSVEQRLRDGYTLESASRLAFGRRRGKEIADALALA